MPKKPRVSTLLDSQHVKPSETIPEMHKKIHKMFFDHFERKSASKSSVLVVSEI